MEKEDKSVESSNDTHYFNSKTNSSGKLLYDPKERINKNKYYQPSIDDEDESNKENEDNQTQEELNEEKDGINTQNIQENIKEVVKNQVTEVAKEKVKEEIKKKILMFIAKNPYVLLVLGIVLLLFLIIVGSDVNNSTTPRTEEFYANYDKMAINSTFLSKEDFITKVSDYFASSEIKAQSIFANNADKIYDIAVENNVNPELVVTRAVIEGFSPGINNNYWGLACYNGVSGQDCAHYESFDAGVLAFVNNISQYETLIDMMYRYAYIGKYWYKKDFNDWGLGGCPYYGYIEKYMTSERSAEVDKYCNDNAYRCLSGEEGCFATTDEDQLAYANFQVEKMMAVRVDIFGEYPESIQTSEYCKFFKQTDPKWGSVNLGKSVATMRDSGCAVTALAMGITCANANLDNNFDAGVFIDTLNENNCFTEYGGIKWNCDGIRKLAPNVYYKTTVYLNEHTISEKIEMINQANIPGQFVLVHFVNDDVPRGHYVKYQDVQNDKIVAMDPSYGKISNDIPIEDVDNIVIYRY